MPAQHVIRTPRSADRPAWQDLWEHYLVFYETTLPAGHTDLLWRRILDGEDPISCIIASVEETPVGIAHYYPHPDTWEAAPVCHF